MTEILLERRLVVNSNVLKAFPRRVDISAFEYAFLPLFGSHRIFYFPHRQPASTDAVFMCPERMADAFQVLLQWYPILAGRLWCAPKCVPYMTDFDHGVCFVTQQANGIRLSEVLPRKDVRCFRHAGFPAGMQLIAPTPQGPILPLVTVHHTRFACGGVTLGIHMSHYVGDGRTLADVMHNWTELFRAGRTMQTHRLSRTPAFPLLSWPLCGSARELKSQCHAFCPVTAQQAAVVTSSNDGTLPFISGFLQFSRADLRELHRQVGESMSTMAVLAAHMAIHITQARQLVAQQHKRQKRHASVQIDLVMDLRDRIFGSGASPSYVGNFNLPSCLLASPSELAPNKFALLARRLHSTLQVHLHSDTYWRETVAWLDQCRNQDITVQHASVCSLGSFGHNVCVSHFGALRFYSIAFHEGAYPSWQSNSDPSQSVEGLIGISETAARDGSVEVSLGLHANDWDELLRLPGLFPNATRSNL